jgi:hypothetical protein
MDAATKAKDVVDPELLIPCSCEVEEDRLPTRNSVCPSQRLVETNARWGAFQFGELTLIGDAEEDSELRAERIRDLCQLASAVLAKLLPLTSTVRIPNVTNDPSTTDAVLEPPTIIEKRIAVQVFVDLRFSCLAKLFGCRCHLQTLLRKGSSCDVQNFAGSYRTPDVEA